MKNRVFFLAVLLSAAFITMPLAAENFSILEIENSLAMGYDFDGEDIAVAQRFGLNFNFTETLNLGFMFQQSSDAFRNGTYLLLNYKAADSIDVTLLYGRTNAPSSGIQVAYRLLSNDLEGLVTSFRIGLEYLLPNVRSGIDGGIFSASLKLGFGI